MRTIIINAADRIIIEKETDGKLDSLQEIVGGSIEAVYAGLEDADTREHHCYVNEEGLLNQPRHFFMFEGGHQPLAGNGVILGTTASGNEAACTIPLDWFFEHVIFMDLDAARRWARAQP
jgi:hypothetical protein